MIRIAITCLTLVPVLCAASAVFAAPAAVPPGDADRGHAAFLRYGCYTCHGYDAQGVPGKKLAPNPLPWPAFSSFVRSSPGEMPTFTVQVLPDPDLADIHAWLRSHQPTPNPATIPLLQELGH